MKELVGYYYKYEGSGGWLTAKVPFHRLKPERKTVFYYSYAFKGYYSTGGLKNYSPGVKDVVFNGDHRKAAFRLR